MKKLRRFIAVIVILVMTCAVMPSVPALAADSKKGVESIEILENGYEYIENDISVGMEMTDAKNKAFYYYNPVFSLLYMKMRIHFDDGGFVDYSLADKIAELENVENIEDIDGDELIDMIFDVLQIDGEMIEITDTQFEKPWTVGGDNSYEITYRGVSVTVPVSVIKSPVRFITVVENPFKYTYLDENRGEGGSYFFEYDETYSYLYLLLEIEYTDGTVEYFRPLKSEGIIMLNDYFFVIDYEQEEFPWNVGKNYYTLHYMGKEVTVPTTVVGNVLLDTSEIFKDVDTGRWYTQYVDYAVSYGLFNGTAKDAFDPGGDMNRAMFVQVLANISGVECDKNAHSGFADVPAGKWYTGAVAWAAENKIVNGMSPTEFDPLRSVTREQICTMLVRYSEHIGIPIQKTADKKVFADDAKISNFAKEAVYLCQQSLIIDGIDGSNFAPKDTATRAQVAKILSVYRMLYLS